LNSDKRRRAAHGFATSDQSLGIVRMEEAGSLVKAQMQRRRRDETEMEMEDAAVRAGHPSGFLSVFRTLLQNPF